MREVVIDCTVGFTKKKNIVDSLIPTLQIPNDLLIGTL